jgi:hypothetical protein
LRIGAIVDVRALSGGGIARIDCAILSVVTVLWIVLALIAVSNPDALSIVTVGAWLTIGLVIILRNASSEIGVTNSDLTVVVEFVVNCIFTALSVYSARYSAGWGWSEDIFALTSGSIARINSAANLVIAVLLGDLAGAGICCLNQSSDGALVVGWRNASWRANWWDWWLFAQRIV